MTAPTKPPIKRAHPIREAKARSKATAPTSEPGFCLREVRECLEVGPVQPDAISAWNAARRKHRTTDYAEIPTGVPIYWTGGKHGHIAIAAKLRKSDNGVRYCWSTDVLRPGYFDRVPITAIRAKWGHAFLGWTEDLNGVTVYPNVVTEDR